MASNTYKKTSTTAQLSVWNMATNESYRVPDEVDAQMRMIARNENPLTSLLESINKTEKTSQMEFRWLEQAEIEWKTTTTASVAAGTGVTTVNVANANYLGKGLVLYVPSTGETMLIESITTLALTVQRSVGDCQPLPIAAGATLILAGASMEEASDGPAKIMRGTDSGVLYVQHHAHGAGISDWDVESLKRGGQEKPRLSSQGMRYFKRLREHAFMLGNPGKETATTSGMPLYFTAGLLYLAGRKNLIDMAFNPSWDAFNEALGHIYQHGSSTTRWGFCGTKVHNTFTRFPEVRGDRQTPPDWKSLGFEVTEIHGGFGSLLLKKHPLFDEPDLSDAMVVTDIGDLRKRVYSGNEIRDKIQTPGAFRQEWLYSEISGLEHMNTYGAGLIRNIA